MIYLCRLYYLDGVCKRWLSLKRLSLQTILVRFTDGTDALLKLVAGRYTNVCSVSIDESPWTHTDHKPVYGEMGLICRFPRIIEPCTIEEMYCLTDAGLAAVGEYFAKLERLRLSSCYNITDVGLISLSEKCKLLKSLALESCFVGDASLAAIGNCCTRLEILNLAYCDSLTDAGLVEFARHRGRSLKSLRIASESVNITDEALQAIGHFCLLLELLGLYGCSKLTNKSLSSIGKGCKKLKTLSIQDCYSLSEVGLDYIARGCGELIRLEISSIGIGTTGVKSIGKLACTNLSELMLTYLQFQNLDKNALPEIGTGYKHLRSLRMISCYGLEEETLLGVIRLCTNLKELYISYCHEIGHEQITCIAENCKSLTHLHLPYCPRITNTEIQAIARAFPQLSCLDISGLKTQDTGILAVSEGCPFLKDLKINSCPNLTDSSLTYIAKNCTLLELCSLNSCPGITKFGVKDFVRRCRNIKEIWGEKWKLSN